MSTIPFQYIPPNQRVPLFYAEVSNANANSATANQNTLIIGQITSAGIAPAGIVLDNTGHHHLFIDTPLPADASQPVPAVEGKVLHFGKGQTEATITLTPGKHTLQLELADA